MTLIWLTVVVGVFNICVGFALGIYVQGKRQSSLGFDSGNDGDPPNFDVSPYRSFASGDAGSRDDSST